MSIASQNRKIMKSFIFSWAVVALLLSLYSCSKNDDQIVTPPERYHKDGGEDDDIPIINGFTGFVKNDSDEPISDANVKLAGHEEYGYEAQTDSHGYFELDLVKQVSYQLIFSADNYSSTQYTIHLDSITGEYYYWGTEVLQVE